MPFPRHVVWAFKHIDRVEYLIAVVLVRTQEVVVGDPERHVVVGTVVIIVTAADPVSGFEGAVEPFNHLLVGSEFPGDRIIVCKPDYLGDVKLEAIPQLLCELQGGQRIGTIPVGNEPELLRKLLHAPESHAHGEDAGPDRAVIRNLVAKNGTGGGIHDEPDVAFDAADLDVGLVGSEHGGFGISVMVNKGLDDNGGGSGIVGDLLM